MRFKYINLICLSVWLVVSNLSYAQDVKQQSFSACAAKHQDADIKMQIEMFYDLNPVLHGYTFT